MRTLIARAALFVLSAVPGAALAEDLITIEVEGAAAVVNGDIAMARDKAVSDAKRKAVEQVVGTKVKSESVTEGGDLVVDRVASQASGFVKSYEIKRELRDGETYYVKIKAVVDKKAIADDVAQVSSVKPRVIVMIAEQNAGAGSFTYWWGRSGFVTEMDIMQNTFIEAWRPKGFKFIEPGVLKGKLKVGKGLKAELGNDDALEIGRDADADVAILGKVVVTDAGTVMEGVKMRSFQAVGSIRVLNVDTGEIIAVADESAAAPHIDGNVGGRQAIKTLASKLEAKLQSDILARWTAEAAGAKELEVEVVGLKKGMFDQLKRFLTSEVRGVEKVVERKKKGGVTYLTLHLAGDAIEVEKAVEAKQFDGFVLQVAERSGGKLVIELGQ